MIFIQVKALMNTFAPLINGMLVETTFKRKKKPHLRFIESSKTKIGHIKIQRPN